MRPLYGPLPQALYDVLGKRHTLVLTHGGRPALDAQVCEQLLVQDPAGNLRWEDDLAAQGYEWTSGGHEFAEIQGGFECCRCSLSCAPGRLAKAMKGKCLDWHLLDAEGREMVEARQWAKWVAMLPTTLRHRHGGNVKLDAAREGPM
eukprot:10392620-Heterocapsa_arctica.AAC.1